MNPESVISDVDANVSPAMISSLMTLPVSLLSSSCSLAALLSSLAALATQSANIQSNASEGSLIVPPIIATTTTSSSSSSSRSSSKASTDHWMIKHGPEDYKTGKSYGDRPPLVISQDMTGFIGA